MAVGTLFPVLRLLTGRATAVRTRDILFLLRLGFHLVALRSAFGCAAKDDASFNDIIYICHKCKDVGLMVEQTDAGERHRDAVFVASVDDIVVAH